MYQRIMVPLDGSQLAECVLPHLEAITTGSKVKEIRFVQAVEPFYMRMITAYEGGGYAFNQDLVKQIDEENERQARAYLDGVVAGAKYESAQVKAEVVIGKAADALAGDAAKN